MGNPKKPERIVRRIIGLYRDRLIDPAPDKKGLKVLRTEPATQTRILTGEAGQSMSLRVPKMLMTVDDHGSQ